MMVGIECATASSTSECAAGFVVGLALAWLGLVWPAWVQCVRGARFVFALSPLFSPSPEHDELRERAALLG